jgi:hypothetical protein
VVFLSSKNSTVPCICALMQGTPGSHAERTAPLLASPHIWLVLGQIYVVAWRALKRAPRPTPAHCDPPSPPIVANLRQAGETVDRWFRHAARVANRTILYSIVL